MSKKPINLTGKSMEELAALGAPYLVDPDNLRALGVDPRLHLKRFGDGGMAWMLDRKKDAALIERLRSVHEPHESMQ
jgi:hypothetical protein